MPLKVLKESNPVEVAEYAVARGIDRELAFSWWVPYTLKKRKAIIAVVRSCATKRTHQYGIEVPNDVNEAKIIDCLLYTSPSPRDQRGSRMPSSA